MISSRVNLFSDLGDSSNDLTTNFITAMEESGQDIESILDDIER